MLRPKSEIHASPSSSHFVILDTVEETAAEKKPTDTTTEVDKPAEE